MNNIDIDVEKIYTKEDLDKMETSYIDTYGVDTEKIFKQVCADYKKMFEQWKKSANHYKWNADKPTKELTPELFEAMAQMSYCFEQLEILRNLAFKYGQMLEAGKKQREKKRKEEKILKEVDLSEHDAEVARKAVEAYITSMKATAGSAEVISE